MISTDNTADPAEVFLSTSPPDDAGAETADRYDWQAMMATADVLSMYFAALDAGGNLLADADFKVVCEHHEDWAVINGSGSEIVSGKHREASVGPLSTYNKVLGEGGVLHLFKRWWALEKTPLCRLVTTGGLSNEGAKVSQACDRLRLDRATVAADVVEVIEALAAPLIGSLKATDGGPPESDDVRAFLASLRFQDSEARRDQIPDMGGERYGRPVAERLGNAGAAGAVWQATLSIVRPRMRAAGDSIGGALPIVLGVPHDGPLAPRTLTLAEVDTAVRFAVAHAAGYAPLPRKIKANRMAMKMARGGCSDNAIERADHLRLQYRQYWRTRQGSPTVFDQKLHLGNTLARVIDETTHVVRAEGATWGAELWHELGTRFRTMEGQADAQGLSADLLLGGISELANNCRAWYTDRFDAKEMLRQVIAEETAS